MHDDALKELWQEQSVEVPETFVDPKEIAGMKRKMKSFDRTIRWRDIIEVGACVFVVLVFGLALLAGVGSLLTRIGYGVLTVSCIFIAWKLISSKRRVPQVDPNAPVFETVQVELQKVGIQIGLLKSVAWWYLLPLFVGLVLCAAGSNDPLREKIAGAIQSLILFGAIYALNLSAVRYRLQPLKAELEALLNPSESVSPMYNKKKHYLTNLAIIAVGVLLYFVTGRFAAAQEGPLEEPPATEQSQPSDPVSLKLEAIRAKHEFPALAAAVVVDGKIVTTNAVGVRRYGSPASVTVDDKFHIGSVTKSMTATVAAMLVEQGKISWTTTIGESFPKWKDDIHADYRDVTLEQLLSHHGGAPGDAPRDLWAAAWREKGTPGEQRSVYVKGILGRKPEAKPGTKYIYSNQGYAVAGVMLELATGRAWEELMREMLFEPLGMTSAGFGAPASLGKVDQPWGHTAKGFGGSKPTPPGEKADNPLAISPAGAVHCSIADLAKYAAFHMAGERGESKLLKAESFKKLHEPVNEKYSLGWVVLDRKWGNGRVLMHNGSNTTFYVVVWLAPRRNCAVVVATNTGRISSFSGCDEAVGEMIEEFFPK